MQQNTFLLSSLLSSIKSMLISMEETGTDHTAALHCLIEQCELLLSSKFI
mgnify:CR=1 FL=1